MSRQISQRSRTARSRRSRRARSRRSRTARFRTTRSKRSRTRLYRATTEPQTSELTDSELTEDSDFPQVPPELIAETLKSNLQQKVKSPRSQKPITLEIIARRKGDESAVNIYLENFDTRFKRWDFDEMEDIEGERDFHNSFADVFILALKKLNEGKLLRLQPIRKVVRAPEEGETPTDFFHGHVQYSIKEADLDNVVQVVKDSFTENEFKLLLNSHEKTESQGRKFEDWNYSIFKLRPNKLVSKEVNKYLERPRKRFLNLVSKFSR